MDLTGQRIIMQAEELKSGVPASEGTMTRAGSAINYVMLEGVHSLFWSINGDPSSQGSIQYNIDGGRALFHNYEIYGVYFSVISPGVSGSFIFDIIRRNTAGATSSLFSTLAQIPYSSGSNARINKRFSDNTLLVQSSGTTLPVLASSSLYAGDTLEFNLLGVQQQANDIHVQLDMRLR